MAAKRRWVVPVWEEQAGAHTPEELVSGTGPAGLRLTVRDLNILESLLDRNYLATRHLVRRGEADGFPDRRKASERMSRLVAEGLVARAKVPAWNGDSPTAWEYAYCLTERGLDCLRLDGREAAERIVGRWSPPFRRNSDKINLDHELAVADLCEAITAAFPAGSLAFWVGSRSLVQRTGRGPLHQLVERSHVHPDAAVLVLVEGGMEVILVEYEESFRPDRFAERIGAYVAYFERKDWKTRYPLAREPRVVISVSTRADRQRYSSSPFQHALSVADRLAPKLWAVSRNLYLMAEEEWRRGDLGFVEVGPAHVRRPLGEVVPLLAARPVELLRQ